MGHKFYMLLCDEDMPNVSLLFKNIDKLERRANLSGTKAIAMDGDIHKASRKEALLEAIARLNDVAEKLSE